MNGGLSKAIDSRENNVINCLSGTLGTVGEKGHYCLSLYDVSRERTGFSETAGSREVHYWLSL